jgi:hypothetical protein
MEISNPWWEFLARARCLPDHCNCEPIRDSWITQPATFWTSFAYFIAALLAWRSSPVKNAETRVWFWCVFLVGLASLFTHASMSEFAISLDMAGISILLVCLPLHRRLSAYRGREEGALRYLLIIGAILAIALYNRPSVVTVGTCVLSFLYGFFEILRQNGRRMIRPQMLAALFWITTGFALFIADDLRWYCPSNDLLKGHTLWHLCSAVSMVYFSRWSFGESA